MSGILSENMSGIVKFLCTALACIFLASCASGKEGYPSEMTVDEIADELLRDSTVEGGFAEYSDAFLNASFAGTEDIERTVRYSVMSSNIDEVGVFRARDEMHAERLASLCREYLRLMLEEQGAFIASYAPEELPKLENAEVRIIGDFVIYSIGDV